MAFVAEAGMGFFSRGEPELWEPHELSESETVTCINGEKLAGLPVMRRKVGEDWLYRKCSYDEIRSYFL